MPNEAQVLEALRPVEDPEIHRSIVELNMVRGIEIDGGNVKVTVALTVAGCPMRTEIIKRVSEAVAPLEGVSHVDVDLVIVPSDANGVNQISMGFFAREDQPVVWRGPMLHKALEQFLTDVHWGEPDFLVVDMPPGTGDIALSMAQFLPRAEVIIVTTPQPAAQRVAQRAAYMAKRVNLSVVGVIENMSFFQCDHGTEYRLFGEGGGQELADQLEVPLLGQVPLVPELRAGADNGFPIVVANPDDEASIAFRSIAERVD